MSNRNLIKIYSALLPFLLLFGCKQATKKIIDRYSSGQPMTEYIYSDKNDTSNFVCRIYYENGQLKHETKIIDNKFVDEKKSFFENGKIEKLEKLFQPTPLDAKTYDCHIVSYRSNGTKESEYQYINDNLNGVVIDYDSNGNKARSATYINGKMNGKEILYFSNGKIKSMVECKNDSAYGYEYEFTENGDTLKAFVHYGLSDNGIFYKKWLSNGRLLLGSYGDLSRSFVIWEWYDKKRALIKSVVDKGIYVDSITNRFTAPE